MSFAAVTEKVFKDVFTENDGQSYCPVRCIGALLVVPAVLMVLGFGGWWLANGKIALMEFVQAVSFMAGVIGAVFGAAVSIKALTDQLLPPGGGK